MSGDAVLISAVRESDAEKVETLLDDGADVDQQDEQGWTPLNWASGQGDEAMVRLLLDRGADVTKTGRDNRTPTMIAKAAGHSGVAALLTEREKELGVWEDPRLTRPYCKAYYLSEVERFEAWPDEASSQVRESDEDASEGGGPVVFVHQDFSTTLSMWHGEDVLVDGADPAWRSFCEETLEFAIPDDLT